MLTKTSTRKGFVFNAALTMRLWMNFLLIYILPNRIYMLIPDLLKDFDPIIVFNSRKRTDFFFIQIGSNDGVRNDPIHEYVIKYNWRGILIEPVKYLFDRLLINYQNRQGLIFENVAISNKNEIRSLYRVNELETGPGTLWGSFSKEHIQQLVERHDTRKAVVAEEVRCISFHELIKKHNVKKIDLLHIDAEGCDYEILKQIDFAEIKPQMILYENQSLIQDDQQQSVDFLQKAGYYVIQKSADNFAYLKF